MFDIVVIVILGVLGLIMLLLALGSFFVVKQQTAAVVERLGKFQRIANAGLHFKIPLVDRIAGHVDLRTEQLDVDVETKTEDNVFVSMPVAVQYFVMPEKVKDAFYRLSNPEQQIQAYVLDVVRGEVPEIGLDDLFKNKDKVAKAVKERLTETMKEFGYSIVQTLVTDINPDEKVKESMNEINAAQRFRKAAQDKGEGEKILKVKAAEADAESKRLQGKGTADQRREIVKGLEDSVEKFAKATKLPPKEVLALVMETQRIDMLREIGGDGSTIFIPYSSGDPEQQRLMAAVAQGQLAAQEATRNRQKKAATKPKA